MLMPRRIQFPQLYSHVVLMVQMRLTTPSQLTSMKRVPEVLSSEGVLLPSQHFGHLRTLTAEWFHWTQQFALGLGVARSTPFVGSPFDG